MGMGVSVIVSILGSILTQVFIMVMPTLGTSVVLPIIIMVLPLILLIILASIIYNYKKSVPMVIGVACGWLGMIVLFNVVIGLIMFGLTNQV